jgi:hypothetical protein
VTTQPPPNPVLDSLHVPPAAFDLQQLFVAQRDVFGGQVRVRAAQQVLPVQVRLGRDLLLVDAQQTTGGGAQEAVQPGHGGDPPAQLGPLRRAEGVGAVDKRGELADHDLAQRGVPVGLFGVEADHEPLVLGDPHLFDLQVVPDMLVAALAGQRGGGLGGARAELLADDVVPATAAQLPAVLL